ncbi:PiggyBac transposable element-derived protein [Lasallia pustulata]|uniref:PiggyBac transposable element-derived protein n=1 Tax=Lasallia pustulata TaxID=136370 RepID=A0A1W5CY86_9LECA|nr:PiggyBac transposable element-derived protein [Lasallia pustulata]
MDNFFTNVKLYTVLKELGIGACGTAKNGSGFPPELLTFREVLTKKNNWGMKAYSTVGEVLCLAWQDNNTVQLMTTVHTPGNMEAYDMLSTKKRHGIPAEASTIKVKNLPFYTLPSVYAHTQPYIERGLPFPTAIRHYNKHMGGSDGNAQGRAYYSPETRSFRYWWPLFKFLIDASILNAYILWKLQYPASKLSHVEFQHQIALALLRSPAGTGRKRATIVQVIGRKDKGLAELEHDWILRQKRAYCQICCVNKDRPLRERKRKPLGKIEGNVVKRPRQRGPQTLWGCKGCQGSACCRNASCWEALHS